jgi:hypothetical protein
MQKVDTDLDLEDDVDYQKRSGVVKKILQGVLFLFILGGLSGVFGYGGWTRKYASGKNLIVEYEKFLRVTKNTPMVLFYKNNKDTIINVRINQPFFNSVNYKEIVPPPIYARSEGGKLTFTFAAAKGETHKIIFNTTGNKSGKSTAIISCGNETLTIEQFVYP